VVFDSVAALREASDRVFKKREKALFYGTPRHPDHLDLAGGRSASLKARPIPS